MRRRVCTPILRAAVASALAALVLTLGVTECWAIAAHRADSTAARVAPTALYAMDHCPDHGMNDGVRWVHAAHEAVFTSTVVPRYEGGRGWLSLAVVVLGLAFWSSMSQRGPPDIGRAQHGRAILVRFCICRC